MIFAYIRTSYWRQSKVSMEMQIESIKAKATELGLPQPSANHVFEDKGVSGAKFEEREGLQSLLKVLQEPSSRHGTLIVYRFNRLSRDVNIMLKILDILEANGIRLISVMENILNSSSRSLQKLIINIYSLTAQFERDVVMENQKMALRQKRREGKPLSNNVPYGYRYSRDKLVSVTEELKVVRYIYDLYLAGEKGYAKIAKDLNQKGCQFNAHPFTKQNIEKILANKTYCGVLSGENTGGEFKGTHEAIITEAEFAQVQELKKRHKVVKKSSRQNWLRKKIVCPQCGRKFTPRHLERRHHAIYDYYYCPNPSCVERYLKADKIENDVKKAVIQFLTQKPVLDQMFVKMNDEQNVNKLQSRRDKGQIDRQKASLFKRFESGEMDGDKFSQAMAQLNEANAKLELASTPPIGKAALLKLLKQQQAVKTKDLPDAFYFNLVERVELDNGYHISAVYLENLDINIAEKEEIVL